MLLKPHYTCGIELTAGSIRMVRADTHNRQDSCLFIPMPKGMCKGALIQSPKLLGKTIRQELKAHRFNPGRRCVLSISATNARIRLTQMPHLEPDALHANVVSDMCRYFSMDADEFYIDYVVQEVLRPQHTEAPQVRVLMLALPKQEVESYLEAFRYAGIPIRAVAITQNVIGKLLRSTGQRQGLSIVLTLNHTSASVDCFLDGWLFISKSLGAGLYAAAAEYYVHGLASDADSAHRALLQQAQNPQQGNAVAQGYLDAILAEYITQVTQLIEYCRKRTGQPAQRLLLCGHAMDMPGIAHAFTGLIADNTVHISTLLPNAPQGCTDCCTVAYASLLRDTKLEPARGRKTT